MSKRADVLLSRRSIEDPTTIGLAHLATSHGSAENTPVRIRAAALKAATAAEPAARAFERAADAHEHHAAIAAEIGLVLEDVLRSREQAQRLRASARREREQAKRERRLVSQYPRKRMSGSSWNFGGGLHVIDSQTVTTSGT